MLRLILFLAVLLLSSPKASHLMAQTGCDLLTALVNNLDGAEGTELRQFFDELPVGEGVRAWEVRRSANVTGEGNSVEELRRLANYIKGKPQSVIDDVTQAIENSGSIDAWIEATIDATSGRTELKNIMEEFGYLNCKTAVNDASGVQANNLAGLDGAGDPRIPNAATDYSNYALPRGSQYAKGANGPETFQEYFLRLKNSGFFNQFESHHLFPVEIFKKSKGFRIWFETVGHSAYAINGKNAANATDLENLIMLEKFATSNNLGVHANHPTYNTTLINYFNTQWANHMSAMEGNVTAASALFNLDIQHLSVTLKEALRLNSLGGGNHKVNVLFQGNPPIIDFSTLTRPN